MSEYVLALDVGMTSVTTVIARAAAHEEFQVGPSAVGRERADIPVLAFITDDGDAIFGAEGAERGRDRPERLVHEFTRSIGDPVPIVVGGFAVSADELFARMVVWIVQAVSAERGARPGSVAIAHPSSWCGHRAKVVRERLREFGVDDLMMMPSAAIAAQQLASDTSRGHTVGVYDLGGRAFEATLLRGGRMLGEPQTTDIGGEDVDVALLAHVLSLLGRDPVDSDGRAELLAARQAVVGAKEGLSFSADVSVPVTFGGRSSTVRVTRSELDAMASAPIVRTLGALERALESARVDIADVDEIILVGGSVRIPLVAQILSAQFDRPLTVPVDPQFAIAFSIARIAWARMQRRSDALEDSAHPVPAQPPAVHRHDAAATRAPTEHTRRPARGAAASVRPAPMRIPYAAAAAMVAAAVIIATGMVFAATTPLGGGMDAANGSAPDEPLRGEPRSLQRTGSGYSTAAVASMDGDSSTRSNSRETDPSGEADVREPPADRPGPNRGGPSVDAPSSEPAGSSSTHPATRDPELTSTGTPPTSTGTTSTSGPIAEPTPDPEPVTIPDPAPEPVADPVPEPTSDPTPTSDPVVTSDPAPTSAPVPTSDPVVTSDPAPTSAPEPTSDPVVTSDPDPAPAAPESPPTAEPPREATPA